MGGIIIDEKNQKKRNKAVRNCDRRTAGGDAHFFRRVAWKVEKRIKASVVSVARTKKGEQRRDRVRRREEVGKRERLKMDHSTSCKDFCHGKAR